MKRRSCGWNENFLLEVLTGATLSSAPWPCLAGPSLIYVITHADLRYRYTVFWITILLSSLAVVWCYQKLEAQRTRVMPFLSADRQGSRFTASPSSAPID